MSGPHSLDASCLQSCLVGSAWMPVLEPVTTFEPNWKVLGLYPNLIW